MVFTPWHMYTIRHDVHVRCSLHATHACCLQHVWNNTPVQRTCAMNVYTMIDVCHTPSYSCSNRTPPLDNSNDYWKRLCLAGWAAAPCVWTLRVLTRNLLTFLLTYLPVRHTYMQYVYHSVNTALQNWSFIMSN